MVQIIWTEPALADLDAITDYIAIENPVAAAALGRRVLRHVEQLVQQPDSGSRVRELGRSRVQQIVEPPCRVLYRRDGPIVAILHVMRTERTLDMRRIIDTDRSEPHG